MILYNPHDIFFIRNYILCFDLCDITKAFNNDKIGVIDFNHTNTDFNITLKVLEKCLNTPHKFVKI